MATELITSELKPVNGSPIPFPRSIRPKNGAVIENPCNRNEMLIFDTYFNKIFIYKKKENIIIQNKIDLTSLQAHDIPKLGIQKMKAFNSTSRQDHVVVVIQTLDYRLWYAIFDCKSYQWVNFTKDTNAKNTFVWAKQKGTEKRKREGTGKNLDKNGSEFKCEHRCLDGLETDWEISAKNTRISYL